jgi:hypothetical protein
MKRFSTRAAAFAGVMALTAVAMTGTLHAQAGGTQATPKGWNYEIKDGKRVPKGNRVTNADGSWREELKQGACTTVKEGSPQGEVRITRRCD